MRLPCSPPRDTCNSLTGHVYCWRIIYLVVYRALEASGFMSYDPNQPQQFPYGQPGQVPNQQPSDIPPPPPYGAAPQAFYGQPGYSGVPPAPNNGVPPPQKRSLR